MDSFRLILAFACASQTFSPIAKSKRRADYSSAHSMATVATTTMSAARLHKSVRFEALGHNWISASSLTMDQWHWGPSRCIGQVFARYESTSIHNRCKGALKNVGLIVEVPPMRCVRPIGKMREETCDKSHQLARNFTWPLVSSASAKYNK